MPVIEKHDLKDVLEVQRIQMLIRHDKPSKEFFETMLRLINKNINNQGHYYDCLSEISSEAGEEIDDYEGDTSSESDEEVALSDS